MVFGRAAMGEAMREGAWSDRWRLRVGGKLVFAENVRLDGAIADKLAQPAAAAGGIALATVLIAPGEEATLAAVRALEDQFTGEVGISAWNGIAVARLCARDGAVLAPRSHCAAGLARRQRAAAVVAITYAHDPEKWTGFRIDHAQSNMRKR